MGCISESDIKHSPLNLNPGFNHSVYATNKGTCAEESEVYVKVTVKKPKTVSFQRQIPFSKPVRNST
jgi:hypothetical protein